MLARSEIQSVGNVHTGVAQPAPMPVDERARHALASLLSSHQSTLRALALRLTRSASDADDLVQETFHRALKSAHLYRANTQLRAWLVTLLHNLFLDRCRARKRDPQVLANDAALKEAAAPHAVESLELFEQFTTDDVKAAAEQLSPEFKETYLLHAFFGLSYAAVALKLGIEKNTVGTRLLRARAQLKMLLLAQKGLAP